ncbi:uncharacterized protein LOC141630421 [Silene latifolia]|uniref:uncharacterized protein LOC141630421 n=1 Tax=Silene latifolia TaxID=37657 RepID=UPI003D774E45
MPRARPTKKLVAPPIVTTVGDDEEMQSDDYVAATIPPRVTFAKVGYGSLSFIKPGENRVTIDESDISEELDYWKYTLFGTILGKTTSVVELDTLVGKNWNHITTLQILYFAKGWYYFRFLCEEDMNKIKHDSWNLNGFPLVFKDWSPTIVEELTQVSVVPIWVLFPNLAPCFWSMSGLSNVASLVGKHVCADEVTTEKRKLAFARVLIEVDIFKELHGAVWLNTPYRGHIIQKVVYEWIPYYCTQCKKIGHTKEKCRMGQKRKQTYNPKNPAPVAGERGDQNTPLAIHLDGEGHGRPHSKSQSTAHCKVGLSLNLDNKFQELNVNEHAEELAEIANQGDEDIILMDLDPRGVQGFGFYGTAKISLQLSGKSTQHIHSKVLHLFFSEVLGVNFCHWSVKVYGSKISTLFQKLKHLKGGLKKLHKSEFSGFDNRVKAAKYALLSCQALIKEDPMHQDLLDKERVLNHTYTKLKTAEMVILKQRAKVVHDNLVDAVVDAFLQFYEKLLGSSSFVHHLPEELFHNGSLPECQKIQLVMPFTDMEMMKALTSIDRHKSPGVDGFTSGFFLDNWSTVGPDFKAAVFEFFEKGTLPRAANSTLLVLVPKKETLSFVLEYRPIACCTTFYKVVSKMLANRLREVLPSLIGWDQAAFVKNSDLFDNSSHAHELTTKYSRARITPRCLLKVDIKKAFDSVNWDFLRNCLVLYGFPKYFVKLFVEISGLTANPLKTCVYFGGVTSSIKSLIMSSTGFSEGDFSFRYLGLPLSTSRFTEAMFKPLLENIGQEIIYWANSYLNYAGKATLINSVVFGILNFWGASILFPKGVAKNLKKILHYALRDASIWQAKSTVSHSWFWKSVIQIKDQIVQFAGNITQDDKLLQDCAISGKFQVGTLFEWIRHKLKIVTWQRTIHDSAVKPKHAVIGALACQNKLPTVDNLQKKRMSMANRCVLYETDEKNILHLFFNCSYSSQVWNFVYRSLCWVHPPCSLNQILQWCKVYNRGKAGGKLLRRVALVATLYAF